MHSTSNDTLNRLSGFVMVVNTLLPALVLLLISIGSAYWVPDYLRSIREAAKEMDAAANDAKKAAGAMATNIATHLKSAEDRVSGITQKVNDANERVEKEIAKVPGKPLRQGLNAAFDEAVGPFSSVAKLKDDFANISVEIGKMNTLKTHFAAFAGNAEKIYERLQGLTEFFKKWQALLWAMLIVIVGWIGLSYVLWAHRRLVTGFAMMGRLRPRDG